MGAVLTLMGIDGVLGSPLLFVLVVLPMRCCYECLQLHSPRVPTLENRPFRRTRASDVGAALPCLRPGFPILASRQSRRQIEASIDRGQSSRTHAAGPAVESPSRLRWQPRIIVRYSRGPQPRRNTKWRRPRYTLKTIGNRKGDCAWSCSRWQTQPEKICKSQRTNQYYVRSEWHWFVRCDLQIFSGCVCHLEQLHAQSPFLFPIVFSINQYSSSACTQESRRKMLVHCTIYGRYVPCTRCRHCPYFAPFPGWSPRSYQHCERLLNFTRTKFNMKNHFGKSKLWPQASILWLHQCASHLA